jgi:predicted enzyme related to lactoylglutathione lyase
MSPTPPRVDDGIAIIFYVGDLRRTQAFYRDVLGIGLEHQGDSPGMLHGALPGRIELVFFQQEVPRGASPQIVFGLAEGGIDTVAEQLALQGVEVVTPVSHAPGGWAVDFRDPDGHPLAFFQAEGLPRRRDQDKR